MPVESPQVSVPDGSAYVMEVALTEAHVLELADYIPDHVHNVQFFQIFEDVRIPYLHHLGVPARDPATGLGHVLVSNHCDYLGELRCPGTASIAVDVATFSKHTITLDFRVYDLQQNCEVARGRSVIVSFDFNNKVKVPLGDQTVALLESLTQSSG